MLVVLAVANLRTPSIAGPVGLVFIFQCIFTVALAYQVHRAATCRIVPAPGQSPRPAIPDRSRRC